jgi:hypothetical protein
VRPPDTPLTPPPLANYAEAKLREQAPSLREDETAGPDLDRLSAVCELFGLAARRPLTLK